MKTEKLYKKFVQKHKLIEQKSPHMIGDKYLWRDYYKIEDNYYLRMKIFFDEHNWKYYIWYTGCVYNSRDIIGGKVNIIPETLYARTYQIDFDGDEIIKMLEFLEDDIDLKFKSIKKYIKERIMKCKIK